MDYREIVTEGPITSLRFHYHPENPQHPEEDPRRYGEFLADGVIRTECGRKDDSLPKPIPPRVISDVLGDLVTTDFGFLLEGYEENTLRSHPLVCELIQVIRREPDLSVVGSSLEVSLMELKALHRLEKTEYVIAVLFAVQQSEHEGARDLLSSFENLKPAGTARISRFAKRMLEQSL